MKKLMVAIAAVASAFGLYATDLVTGTSFEGLSTDALFDKTKDDEGKSNPPWWFSAEAEIDGTITAYLDGEPFAGACGRPAKFSGDTQTKYLALETGAPLYRGATNMTQGATTVDAAFTAQDIGTGFYVDQLVKFTAPSDGESTVNLDGGKIAVWLKEVEEGGNVIGTNLMVTAGFFDGAAHTVQTNYVATLADDKDAASLVGSWHRVTIKAIPATTDDIAGFIVYIDGVAVSTDDAIVADDITPAFSPLGSKYAGLKQLFPSAVFSGGNKLTIAAVGFQGSGAIDDVSLTTVVPSFAKDDVTFDLDWNPDEIIAITAGDKELTDGELALGAIQLTLPPNTTSLEVIATPVDGYTASLLAKSGCEVDEDGKTFTFETSAKGGIVATRNFFEVGGKGYPTFADALAAVTKEVATITLKADCTIDSTTISGTGIVVDKAVTLDLAGNNLFVDDDQSLFRLAAAFTVVNSGNQDAKIGVENVEEAQVFKMMQGGTLTIGVKDNESNFVVVEGGIAGGSTAVTLYQGKFNYALNQEEGEFLYNVGDGYNLTSDEGKSYWTVKKAGVEPVKYEVTFTTNGAPYSVVGNVVSNTAFANIKPADPLIEGYTFKGWNPVVDAIDGTVLSFAAVLEANPPVPETYDITINPTENGTLETSVTNDVEVGTTVTVTATPAEGYELESIKYNDVDITEAKSFEMPAEDVTVAATFKKVGGDYPPFIPDDPVVKGKYDTWKLIPCPDGDTLLTVEEDLKDAFLLNCAPGENALEKARKEFTIASIEFKDGEWVVKVTNEKGQSEEYGNGYVDIISVKEEKFPTAGDEADFFQAQLTIQPVLKK